jgi:hypothetical protein
LTETLDYLKANNNGFMSSRGVKMEDGKQLNNKQMYSGMKEQQTNSPEYEKVFK